MRRVHGYFMNCCLLLAGLGCSSQGYEEDYAEDRQPSICGGTTDWQEVESYDGTLGPTVGLVASRQAAVGRLHVVRTEDGVRGAEYCTGTMISPHYFLTAAHCAPPASWDPVYTVRMNYQFNTSGGHEPSQDYPATFVEEGDDVDYAVLRLDDPAGDDWGKTPLAAFGERAGQAIAVIQHPSGTEKKVEGGTLSILSDGRFGYDDLDTLGGSSGSGILKNATGALIGIHTANSGDTCSPTAPNRGWPILAAAAESALVQSIAFDSSKLVAAAL